MMLAIAVALVLAGCSSLFPQIAYQGDAARRGVNWADRTVVGYVPYWDQARAFEVVHANLDVFDRISPMWYSLDAEGNVVLADDENVHVDAAEVRFLQGVGIQVIPTISNLRDGEWRDGPIRTVLHDPELRAAHVGHLVDLAVREGYDGMDVDYEHLRATDRDVYSTFMRDLGNALHAKGKLLTTTLYAKQSEPGPFEHNKAQDYRAIGAAVDQVQVMTYDYHWSDSEPGPVAPTSWVEDVVAWTVTQIPKHKVLLGAGLLGYDWVNDGEGATVSYQEAMSLADRHGASISRDVRGSPWFTYTDRRGRGHEVWFEDVDSIEAKLRLVEKYDLAGVFFWRLGGEDVRVWSLVK